MSPHPFSVTITAWSAHQDELRSVRTAVFVEELGIPETLEWDQQDANATHALARAASGQVIGTGRLQPTARRIGRMAVRADWRGRGVGRAILAQLLDAARAQGLTEVVLHAQVKAAPFYQQQGFVRQGATFLEAGIEHQTMHRQL